MSKSCDVCSDIAICIRLCGDMEVKLKKVNKYSLDSNYLVKFVDPLMIEKMCHKEELGVYLYSRKFDKLCSRLNKELEKLSPTTRLCVIHYFGLYGVEEKTQSDIAKMISRSQNTVKYHIMSAKEKLCKVIGKII